MRNKLIKLAQIVAPLLVLGVASVHAKKLRKEREAAKRNEQLADLMALACSTHEGVYFVEKALAYGQYAQAVQAQERAAAEQAAAQATDRQVEPEENDAVGKYPTADDEPATPEELKAYGLEDAPLVREVLPNGTVIIRRKIPITLTLKEMKA